MNYLAQAKMTEDNYLIMRIKACAAGAGIEDPHLWTMNNIWALCASDGWAAAYGRVLEGEDTTDPANWAGIAGADPEVITDQMILDAVGQRVSLSGTMDTA